MEIGLGVFAAVIGTLGLLIAYVSHPAVVRKIRANPSSVPALIARYLIPKTGHESQIPDRISLYDVIYDRQYKEQILQILDRISANRDEFVSRIGKQINHEFLIEPKFKENIDERKLSYVVIIAALVAEFGSHLYLLRDQDFVADRREIGLRDGYFVVFSKERSCFTLHMLCNIENDIDPTENWADARDAYFVARLLPFRYVFSCNPVSLVERRDISQVMRIIKTLYNKTLLYVASTSHVHDTTRNKNAGLITRIESAFRVAEMLHDTLIKSWPDENNTADFLMNAELMISYCHKIVYGASSMGDTAIFPKDVCLTIEMVWRSSSPKIIAVAQRPANSRWQDRKSVEEAR